jgi:membrane-bound serine protease (ClpP class)
MALHASPARSLRTAIVAALLAMVAFAAAWSSAARAEPAAARPLVVTAEIRGAIDPGVAPYLARVLREAERDDARAVVLRIDTFGGRLDSAVAMRDSLLASPVKTIAFVEGRAISAGALISLASETIVMRPGSSLGAATPVELQAGGPSRPVDEKTVSYVRKEFKATAEQRGRPPALAEAMVDADVDVEGHAPRGKLLTLTADEALALGVADMHAGSLEELLTKLDLAGAEVRESPQRPAERLVRLITNPIIASILMTLGVMGLLVEIRTPGFGVPGLVGVLSLALLLGGHYIARLAGVEQIALVGLGVALIALEIFVVPGFGITGIAGLLALALGLGLTLVGSGATAAAIASSLARVLVSFVVAILGMIAIASLLPRARFARGIILDTRLGAGDAGETPLVAAAASPRWVGAKGRTLTPLRPAGVVRFGNARVDVVTEGGFVDAEIDVEAIAHEGGRVVVRRLEAAPTSSSPSSGAPLAPPGGIAT